MTNRVGWGFPSVVVCVTVMTTLAGCGGREFAEVEGTVTMDGKPMPDIEVLFLPDPAKGNKGNTSGGMTDKEGRYSLRNDRDKKDGTVLGMHRVLLIDDRANRDPSGLNNPPSRIPMAYADAGQTPLTDVEIKSGKQTINFPIDRKLP